EPEAVVDLCHAEPRAGYRGVDDPDLVVHVRHGVCAPGAVEADPRLEAGAEGRGGGKESSGHQRKRDYSHCAAPRERGTARGSQGATSQADVPAWLSPRGGYRVGK